MKNRLSGILIFCLIFPFLAGAQDLIVTSKGDSLNVKIGSVDHNRIYFSRKENGRKIWSFADRDSIQDFMRNYYKPVNTAAISKGPEKIRIGISAGGAMQTGNFSMASSSFEQSDTYMNGLRWGYTFGADASYFLVDIVGAGIRYNYFHAENRMNDLTMEYTKRFYGEGDTTYVINGDLRDKITINFIGPEFVIRLMSKNQKWRYNTTFAFGLLTYHNDFIRGTASEINASNIGMNLAFCPEYKISKNLVLGAEVAFMLGSITKYHEESDSYSRNITLKSRGAVDMTRIDLSLCLRWIR